MANDGNHSSAAPLVRATASTAKKKARN